MRFFLQLITRLANMGTTAINAPGGTLFEKRIRLVNILSLVCASVGLLSLPFDGLTAPSWMILEDIMAVFVYILIPFINRTGRHQTARLLFLMVGNAIIFADTMLLGTASGISLPFFGLAAFALTIFDLTERLLLWITVLLPIGEYFFFALTGFTAGHDQLAPATAQMYFVYSSLVTFVLLGLSIYFLQKANNESEMALQRSRAQAVQSAKMAALGEMSSGLAHEINTPLMALQLNVSLLRTLFKTPAPEPERLDQITDKIDRMIARITKVTRSLQAFSRSGEFDPAVSTSMKFIVAEALELCAEKFKKAGIDLQIETIPDHLSVECRAVQISQVLLNLLNNAYGAVSTLHTRWVQVSASDDGAFVSIAVTDSGRGIPAQLRDRIFEPFFTTKKAGEGTGLGLSISKGIVEDHGGEIYIDPKSDHTRFIVRLPRG